MKATLLIIFILVVQVFADGPRGQFLDGSWHARSALMANADKVQELASKLPYMNFLK